MWVYDEIDTWLYKQQPIHAHILRRHNLQPTYLLLRPTIENLPTSSSQDNNNKQA